jgi:hypothetical protein
MLGKISTIEVANSEWDGQERLPTQALLDIASALKKIAISESEIQKELKAIVAKR